MYVTLDMDNLVFVHKHERQETASMLASIELPHVTTRVQPCDSMDDFKDFTDLELLKLYQNTTGSDHKGFFRPALLAVVFDAVQRVPESRANSLEVHSQLLNIKPDDERRHSFVPGRMHAKAVDELFPLVPLRAARSTDAEKHAAALPHSLPATTPAALPVQQQGGPAPRPRAAASAPAKPVERPKQGSATGRVWDIADKLRNTVPDKELRKAVVAACSDAGINSSTASVQFGHWRKANNA